jgi:hypothetical protein
MKSTDISELRSFLSGYFHQDWQLDASDSDEVISQFLRSRPTSNEINRIVAQIDGYLAAGKDDAALARGLLEDLGCCYLPSADGMSVREWLRHITTTLLSKK